MYFHYISILEYKITAAYLKILQVYDWISNWCYLVNWNAFILSLLLRLNFLSPVHYLNIEKFSHSQLFRQYKLEPLIAHIIIYVMLQGCILCILWHGMKSTQEEYIGLTFTFPQVSLLACLRLNVYRTIDDTILAAVF